ncbi:unnamed protein product [Phytophthora fragariaefolia]|uniref:Unnamed protein product n=1 Tax=Phytophthora fragariaefolia TaxID=1490495 RepID=A0A9W6XLZ6_9STRA|nr:unnamed protein product [Phytophthora fragariaefolia]
MPSLAVYSSVSTTSSALENSDYGVNQGLNSVHSSVTSVNYAEEQFESESEDIHESAPANSDTSSEKYASDEFEDDHEAATIHVPVESPWSKDNGDEEKDNSTDENDYGSDSFEQEEELVDGYQKLSTQLQCKTHCRNEDATKKTEEQREVDDSEAKGEIPSGEGGVLLLAPERKFNPQVATWCSKMMLELREGPKNELPQKSKRVAEGIPSAAVKSLMHQAMMSHNRYSPPQIISWKHSCQNIKAPASLLQRVQTQHWLSISACDNTDYRDTPPGHATLKQPPTPARFCSVAQEKLLGQLATQRLPETTERWTAPDSGVFCLETLDFVQKMAARQREVYRAGSNEPGGRMLHRVAVEAQLQLEESIALRRQADVLLDKA